MKILDREQLGLKKFWREFKNAERNNEQVLIITHRNHVGMLQKDIRLLLRKTIVKGGTFGVMGLTDKEILIILEIVQWVIILTLVGVVIYMVSKRYKFKVRKDKDGNIIIEGEPTT